MSSYESCRQVTVEAGTAITIYRFLEIAADGLADHNATAQGPVAGIAAETQATVGRDLPMVVPDAGFAKVEAAEALAVGDQVASDASGKAIAWVDAAGNVCLGKVVRSPSTADGDIVTIQFYHRQTGAGT